MKFLRPMLILVLALSSTACYGLDNLFNKLPTGASDTTSSSTSVRSYLGTWIGPTVAAPSASSCTALQWKVTSQTATQITGDFTGTCAGIALVGTVVASITDATTIPWAASGNATQGTTTCGFTLAGTGTFQGTSNILVNYSGTVCGAAVSGTETIKRS